MRVVILLVFTVAFAHAAPIFAQEKDLLQRFQAQNAQARLKFQTEVKDVLDRAQVLEKDQPAKALDLLQETRNKFLQRGLLTTREDRVLAEPLSERIQALREIRRATRAQEISEAIADFRDFQGHMYDELAIAALALVPPTKPPPPGWPAYIAFTNGTVAVGWLHDAPLFVVRATVNDHLETYPGGLVAGVQTADAYYIYQRASKQFVKLPPSEFFVMALAANPSARRSGFWVPTEIPPPPVGFYKRSIGVIGASLFAHSSGMLMIAWAAPGGRTAEPRSGSGSGNDTPAARLYRDLAVELSLPRLFRKLKRDEEPRLRNLVMNFFDQRPRDVPMRPDEIAHFSDVVAEVFPDRRADAVAFAHVLNHYFEQRRSLKTP